jgi:hypothetical protein
MIVTQTNPYALFERQYARWQQNPNATTINLDGVSTALTATGTASLLQDSSGEYISYASAATTGTAAGVLTTFFGDTYGNHLPFASAIIKIGAGANDLTAIRIWCGICSADPTAADTPGAVSLAAFRYATTTDGTVFWRTVTSDGASATTTTTTQAIALNTRYVLMIDWSIAGRVIFSIDDQVVATHTANLPAGATGLGLVAQAVTKANVAKNFRFRRFGINAR